MSTISPEDHARIVDYLAGEVSPEAAEPTRQWIQASPDRERLLRQLEQSRLAMQTNRTPVIDSAVLQQVLAKHVRVTPVHDRRSQERAPFFGRPWRRIATTLGVAAAAAAGITLVSLDPSDSLHDAAPNAALGASVYATKSGQTASITLPDGSRIVLAPSTTVRAKRGFGKTHRLLDIDGEVYADIAPESALPFVVRAHGAEARVLGTRFTVRGYEDAPVRVAVETGKVAVSQEHDNGAGIVLMAGDVGEVRDSVARTLDREPVTPYTAWMNGRLVFHDAPLPEVLASFKRWFGYEIQLADTALASENVTIGVSINSSAEAFITLKRLLDADLVIKDSVVTLRAKQGSPTPRRERRDSFLNPSYGVGR